MTTEEDAPAMTGDNFHTAIISRKEGVMMTGEAAWTADPVWGISTAQNAVPRLGKYKSNLNFYIL